METIIEKQKGWLRSVLIANFVVMQEKRRRDFCISWSRLSHVYAHSAKHMKKCMVLRHTSPPTDKFSRAFMIMLFIKCYI